MAEGFCFFLNENPAETLSCLSFLSTFVASGWMKPSGHINFAGLIFSGTSFLSSVQFNNLTTNKKNSLDRKLSFY